MSRIETTSAVRDVSVADPVGLLDVVTAERGLHRGSQVGRDDGTPPRWPPPLERIPHQTLDVHVSS